jgi:hypothetical protein
MPTGNTSESKSLRKPIFIVGVGRSGSTIFQWMLAEHPNLAWLSALTGRLPERPWMTRLWMRAIDLPLIGPRLTRLIYPGECFDFWEHHVPGFSAPCRDLMPGDVTHKTEQRLRRLLPRVLTGKRDRLLVKLTGWPRIGFLRKIFPDAVFIHLIRDGRAVVNSMLNVDWWYGWRGPQNWRWGELTPAQREEWESHDRSFVALAAIEWKLLMDAFEEAQRCVDADSYLELTYEDLCVTPLDLFRQVTAFCDLPWSPAFERALASYELRNTNDRWQRELTPEQQTTLEAVLGLYLERYGYA